MEWIIPLIAALAGLIVGVGVLFIIYSRRLKALADARSAIEIELRVAEGRLGDAQQQMERLRDDHRRVLENLKTTFKGVSADVLKESREEFLAQATPKLGEQIRPLAEALARYDVAIRDIEKDRKQAYGGLSELMRHMQEGQQQLTDRTGSLVAALKSSQARGRWGEMTLKRVVEIAGMVEHCDFEEQATVLGNEGRQRPDLTVRMAGGRTIVVDAKAPLDAYMVAMETTDEQARATAMAAHAQAVRDHIKALSQRAYWKQFENTPDFVIMFIPGESFFSAALEQDHTLIEDGMKSRVMLATPTTLIVMLRSVAMGWKQEAMAENAQKISEAGKTLFERVSTFAKHLNGVGRGLEGALKLFNKAVGSWESRVIPGARTLRELGATKETDAALPEIEPVETLPRELPAPEGEEAIPS